MKIDVAKYKGLMIGGGICLVLFIAGLVFLFILQSGYRSVKQDLNQAQQQLQRLNQRDPYPAQENIRKMEENLERLQGFYHSFVQDLMNQQAEPMDLERAEFPTLLERTFTRLFDSARSNAVAVSEDFAFGFARYAEGALPVARHINRLTVQVQMVEEICSVLFESGIRSLDTVGRDEFEIQQVTEEDDLRGRRREAEPRDTGVPTGEDTDLYDAELFQLNFTCSDLALWDVLSGFAEDPMFTVVRSATLVNDERPDKNVPMRETIEGQAGGSMNPDQEGKQERILSHEERIVAGREHVTAELVVEVYRFKATRQGESAE